MREGKESQLGGCSDWYEKCTVDTGNTL